MLELKVKLLPSMSGYQDARTSHYPWLKCLRPQKDVALLPKKNCTAVDALVPSANILEWVDTEKASVQRRHKKENEFCSCYWNLTRGNFCPERIHLLLTGSLHTLKSLPGFLSFSLLVWASLWGSFHSTSRARLQQWFPPGGTSTGLLSSSGDTKWMLPTRFIKEQAWRTYTTMVLYKAKWLAGCVLTLPEQIPHWFNVFDSVWMKLHHGNAPSQSPANCSGSSKEETTRSRT